MPPPPIPVCLTVAGSDSGGGAGIQADLRTFNWFGVYGACAVTAVTVQNPHAVVTIHPLPAAQVAAQVRAGRQAYTLGAVKTGMLFSAEVVRAVAGELATLSVPLVIDPVMQATSGAELLQDEALAVLRDELLPRAALITPNLPEAARLLGESIPPDRQAMRRSALKLAESCRAVLLTGGHLASAAGLDVLAYDGRLYELSAPKLAPVTSHGTGCTLSAAITANLALGRDLVAAVTAGKAFVWQSLQNIRRLGPGTHGLYPPAALGPGPVTVKEL